MIPPAALPASGGKRILAVYGSERCSLSGLEASPLYCLREFRRLGRRFASTSPNFIAGDKSNHYITSKRSDCQNIFGSSKIRFSKRFQQFASGEPLRSNRILA
jgi:hypothetical protein